MTARLCCLVPAIVACWLAGPVLADGYDDAEAALAAYSDGNLDAALEAASRALDTSDLSDRDRALMLHLRGSARLEVRNDMLGAIDDFDAALALQPDDATVLFARAHARRSFGLLEAAIDDFNAGLIREPDNALALFSRGLAHLDLGETDAAEASFGAALDFEPSNETYRRQLSALLASLNRPALASYSYVTGLNPAGDNWLALRDAPNGNLLARMGPETLLTVLGDSGNWKYVRVEDGPSAGMTGWSYSTYITCCIEAPVR